MRGYQCQMPCDWWPQYRSTNRVAAAAEASWSGSCLLGTADPILAPRREEQQREEGRPTGREDRRCRSEAPAAAKEAPAEARRGAQPANQAT